MTDIEAFQRLGLALAIGFLVGIERGWKQRAEPEGERAAGLRTYTLAGLFGGVAGALQASFGALAFGALALAFCTGFIAFKWRENVAENDFSATGMIAGLLVFALGAWAQSGSMALVAAAAVAATSILAFKEALHGWLRTLTWAEIRSALLILGMTFIALPLLPDRPIDPFGAINPRSLWLLSIVLAAASFVGYVLVRVLGAGAGLLVGAAAGALASSTAVIVDLARRVRHDGTDAWSAASAAAVANGVTFLRVLAVTATLVSGAFVQVLGPLAASVAVSGLGAFALRMRRSDAAASSPHHLPNPLDLRAVIQLALLIGGLTAIARVAAVFLGDAGAFAFAAAAGVADVDAATVAVGGLAQDGLPPRMAADAILLAVAVNTLSKALIAAATGSLRFGLAFGAVSLATLAAGGAARVFLV